MRELVGRVVHSPWFVLFAIAVPIALAIALVDTFSAKVVVTSIHVEVLPTEPDGDPWDNKGALPDPHLKVMRDGKKVLECAEARDQLVLDCAPGVALRLGKPIRVVVGDVDVTSDDPIGEVELELPREGGTLVRENVAGIKKLVVALVPRAGAAERFGTRLIAVAAGVLVIVLAWFLGLRRPLGAPGATAASWIGGALVLGGLITGGLLAYDPDVYALPAEVPCALGAAGATLAWLHASVTRPLAATDAVLMFFGATAVLLPIVLNAALIVAGVAIAYVIVVGFFEWLTE